MWSPGETRRWTEGGGSEGNGTPSTLTPRPKGRTWQTQGLLLLPDAPQRGSDVWRVSGDGDFGLETELGA